MSQPDFITVVYGKRQFEKIGCTIYKFTMDFLHRNEGRSLSTTRQEVDWHWQQQIMSAYPQNDDPMRIFLLEQVSCPLSEMFWEKQADEEAFKKKRAEQRKSGFHIITRNRTPAEAKIHKNSVIMTHSTHGDIIIPDILLRPLHRVSFLSLIRKILTVNSCQKLGLSVLQELWVAVLDKVYGYEYKWQEDKKLEGVTASSHVYESILTDIAQSKKRQHSETEEDSSSSDAPIAKRKQAKTSTKPTKVPKASGSLDTTQTTTKAQVPANVSRAEGPARSSSDAGPSIIAPPPTRPANAAPARSRTKDQRSAKPSSSRRTQPPPPSQASATHHSSSRIAELPSSGAAPWPYDPDTGNKTGSTNLYRLDDREDRMLRFGVPPWPYDPRTGEKTKIETINVWKVGR